MKAIRRVWRGEAGLAWTFWVWGVAVNVVLNGFSIILLSLSMDNPVWGGVVLGSLIVRLGYQVFITVAVWRAANRYTGYKGWAFLAKAVIVLGILQTLANLFGMG